MPSTPPDEHGIETRHQRLNREFDQLLQGLRVAQPGVQVLFAFLLTAPLANGFGRLDHDARLLYLLAVTTAAVSAVCLIAPSVHHRVRFREGTKAAMITAANVLAQIAFVALAVSMASALYVVGDVAFPETPARWIGPGIGALAALVWFALPRTFESRPDRS